MEPGRAPVISAGFNPDFFLVLVAI